MVHPIECFLKVQAQEAGSVLAVVKSTQDIVPKLNYHVFRPTSFFPPVLVGVWHELLPEFLEDDTFQYLTEVRRATNVATFREASRLGVLGDYCNMFSLPFLRPPY